MSTDLAVRLDALDGAVRSAEGRLDGPAIDTARTLVARAGERLKLSGEHTVVALAGATGSGKSSLFNSLVGLDLSAVGVRRPTTNTALACVWGSQGASALLDWLHVPRRHQISRDSELDVPADDDLDGLVLLDLPDFDSTSVEHRVEVDRLIGLVDLFVWVVDPQKYADNVLHQLYLRRLNRHDDVMLMVLNKVDLLDVEGETACISDLRRLLIEDGLRSVPVLPISARTDRGIADLRAVLAEKVSARAVVSRPRSCRSGHVGCRAARSARQALGAGIIGSGGISSGRRPARRRPHRGRGGAGRRICGRALLPLPSGGSNRLAVHALGAPASTGSAAATASRHGYPRRDRRCSVAHLTPVRHPGTALSGRYGGTRGGYDRLGRASGGVGVVCALGGVECPRGSVR